MFDYFRLLEEHAGEDEVTSIHDLTVAIAESAGYYRDMYEYAVGTKRERTFYRDKFDSVLTAKWLCFYKKMFISCLLPHTALIPNQVDIINRTFYIFMGCLNLEKLVNDKVVTTLAKKVLTCRIADALNQLKAKDANLNEIYSKNDKLSFRIKSVIDASAVALNTIERDCKYSYTEKFDDFQSEEYIKQKIKSTIPCNPFVDRLYKAMLEADGKMTFKNIDIKIGLRDYECTNETKRLIADAFNRIKFVVMSDSDLCSNRRFKRVNTKAITYSFEGN